MKNLAKIVSGFMALALTLVIAGCSGGNADISKANVCKAFDKYGAQKIDEFDDFKYIIGNRTIEAEGGYYYTSKAEDELDLMVKNVMFRFQDIPDWDAKECTCFVATSKDEGSMNFSYILILGNESDATAVFNYLSEDMSYDDTYTSGNTSGVNYAVSHEEDSKETIEGVYQQGNSVFWTKAYASEIDGLKEYENIIKNVGLVSPLGK